MSAAVSLSDPRPHHSFLTSAFLMIIVGRLPFAIATRLFVEGGSAAVLQCNAPSALQLAGKAHRPSGPAGQILLEKKTMQGI